MWSNIKMPFMKNPEKEVQTIIRVYPHLLESNKVTAHVISESRCQTEISVKPDQDDKLYYSMLEYIPFQDIQESSIRVVNLPRKLKLHFCPKLKLNIYNCLFDDDGINELCIDLKARQNAMGQKGSITYENKHTQTDD